MAWFDCRLFLLLFHLGVNQQFITGHLFADVMVSSGSLGDYNVEYVTSSRQRLSSPIGSDYAVVEKRIVKSSVVEEEEEEE